jgi:hypothetical protein
MFTVVRNRPIHRDASPSDLAQQDGIPHEPLVDLALLLCILNPIVTPEEEHVLRRLRAVRVPEPRPTFSML